MASVFAFPDIDAAFIGICLEGFLYGLYSGIFVIYLKFQSDRSRKATIVFYALCLLYVLSTATVVSDLVIIMIQLLKESKFQLEGGGLNIIPPEDIIEIPIIFPLGIVQTLASGLCDFIAQCILIYRCWIVWDQNIRVVIIPSILAIAYIAIWLGSDSQLAYNSWINTDQAITSIVKWTEGTMGFTSILPDPPTRLPLDPVIITSFALSIAVNTLVTGLIVFKILKVFLEVKPTSVERTLGATGGSKLRHIIFIIIESGMALFAIQLVRVVLSCLPLQTSTVLVFNLTTGINQMFNGIAPTIILVRVSMRLSIDDNESFKEAALAGSLRFNNLPRDQDTLQQVTVGSSRTSMQTQESPEETRRSEDIFYNNPPSNPNTLRSLESSSSMPPQEKSENTTV